MTNINAMADTVEQISREMERLHLLIAELRQNSKSFLDYSSIIKIRENISIGRLKNNSPTGSNPCPCCGYFSGWGEIAIAVEQRNSICVIFHVECFKKIFEEIFNADVLLKLEP